MKVEENVSVSSLTTFQVGGTVAFVITVETEHDIPDAVAFARKHGLPLIPLGGGSNLLGRDEYVPVALVRIGLTDHTVHGTVVSADAGASWDVVVSDTVSRDLWGMENLSAIPGTVGGAVVQNIGAYGAVLGTTCTRVDAYDTHDACYRTFTTPECDFGYRSSVFKECRDRYIIVRAHFTLSEEPVPILEYADLRARFENTKPALSDIRDAVCAVRACKFPTLHEYGTAGSFFLNPVVTQSEAALLQKKFPSMPLFTLPEGGIKVPLGWLFEHVLGIRGMSEAGVESWRGQALVITAERGTSATAVRAFAKKIQNRVRSELGLMIEPEVRFL